MTLSLAVNPAPAKVGAGFTLENYANKSATPGKPTDSQDLARLERWRVRGVLAGLTHLERVRKCGRVTVSEDRTVTVRANGTSVGFSGLATCGSVWACPVCNSKIQASRRLEIGVAVTHVLGAGGGAMFGAYTLRHHKGTDPNDLWRSLSTCWNAMSMDRKVRELRRDLGHIGYIRAAEVTYGDTFGWHPHTHPIHLFDRPVIEADAVALHTEQVRAWTSAAHRLGLDAPSTLAQHLHVVTAEGASGALSEYLSKVTWEMTSTQTKQGKGSLTPWEILKGIDAAEDEASFLQLLDLWHDWEGFSKGKRALSWSRGLRKRVGLAKVEKTDEQLAAEAVGREEDGVLFVEDWAPFVKNPTWGASLLAAVGPGGDALAGLAWCSARGVQAQLIQPSA